MGDIVDIELTLDQQMEQMIETRAMAARKMSLCCRQDALEMIPTWWVHLGSGLRREYQSTHPSSVNDGLRIASSDKRNREGFVYGSMNSYLKLFEKVGSPVMRLVVTPLDAAVMESCYLANVPADKRREDVQWKDIVHGLYPFMDSNEPLDVAARFLAMFRLYLQSKFFYFHPEYSTEWMADVGAYFALRNILAKVQALIAASCFDVGLLSVVNDPTFRVCFCARTA
jgi:hypothetical protein